MRDKNRYVRGLAEEIEGHLNVNDLHLAYRALKKLHTNSTPWVSFMQAADDGLLSDMAGEQTHWAEYFEQLYMAKPPT